MGEMVFRKVLWGKEATPGTAVAADTVLALDTLRVTDARTRKEARYMTGYRTPIMNMHDVRKLMEFEAEGPVYFEQLPIWMSMGLKGHVTPSASGTEYTWSFTPSGTATNTPDTGTIEYGDDTQAWETEYVFCRRFNLKGNTDDFVTLTAGLVGRQLSTCSFSTVAFPTLTNPANGAGTKIFIDTTGAAIGSTPKTGLLIDYDLSVEYYRAAHFMDGYLYFSKYKEPELAVTLSMTLEFDSTGNTEHTAYVNKTKRFVRLANSGDQIGVGNFHNFTFDMCGIYSQFPVNMNDDRDGNNIAAVTLVGVFDNTWGKMFDCSVLTTTSAI